MEPVRKLKILARQSLMMENTFVCIVLNVLSPNQNTNTLPNSKNGIYKVQSDCEGHVSGLSIKCRCKAEDWYWLQKLPFPTLQQRQQVKEVYPFPSFGLSKLELFQCVRIRKRGEGKVSRQFPKGEERTHFRYIIGLVEVYLSNRVIL